MRINIPTKYNGRYTMLVKVIKSKKVICLVYSSTRSLMEALLRFQETYESPEFTGKVFTVEEFKKWYIKNSPNGKKTGKFTYYEDWGGCNFPCEIVERFFKGEFKPLSVQEKEVLKELKPYRGKQYYVIGLGAEKNEIRDVLIHECAHAMYRFNKTYKKNAHQLINSKLEPELADKLLKIGYSKEVLDDEMQAFILAGCSNKKLIETYRPILKGWLYKAYGKELDKMMKEMSYFD
jgi:hypothetical protein